MTRAEILKRVGVPMSVAAASAALIFALGKVNESTPGLSSETELGTIYQPAAIKIGKMALLRAGQDRVRGTISRDPKAPGTIDVLVETYDGSYSYEIFALMRERNGKPDPSTTYEALIQQHYGQGDKIKEEIYITNDSPVAGKGSWGAIDKTFSRFDQVNPTTLSTAETASSDENKITAEIAKTLTEIAVLAPSNLQPDVQNPENGITV